MTPADLSTLQIVIALLGTAGAGSAVTWLGNAIVDRRKRQSETAASEAEAALSTADATQRISSTAIEWMEKFEARAEAAHARAEAAEATAADAQRLMREVREEARDLAAELRRIRTAIMRPDATVEGLRLLVSGGGGINGRTGPGPL